MENPISKPVLPPKEGYVEIELDGQRFYKRIYTLFEQEQMEKDLDRDLINVDQEYRITLIELGLTP